MISIGGTSYNVLVDGAQENLTPIGTSTRSFSGKLRSSIRSVKRSWSFKLMFMSQGQYSAFKALHPYGSFRSCSGDALGDEEILCEVRYDTIPYLQDGLSFVREVSVTLTEA